MKENIFLGCLTNNYINNETFTIVPTKFSIRIIETGYIHNVKLCIGINNTQIEIPCKHQKRYSKIIFKKIKKSKPFFTHKTNIPRMHFPVSDLFVCEYCFQNETNCAYYYFKYTIEATNFETKKVYFRVEKLFV